jgi:hypothetical protein
VPHSHIENNAGGSRLGWPGCAFPFHLLSIESGCVTLNVSEPCGMRDDNRHPDRPWSIHSSLLFHLFHLLHLLHLFHLFNPFHLFHPSNHLTLSQWLPWTSTSPSTRSVIQPFNSTTHADMSLSLPIPIFFCLPFASRLATHPRNPIVFKRSTHRSSTQ